MWARPKWRICGLVTWLEDFEIKSRHGVWRLGNNKGATDALLRRFAGTFGRIDLLLLAVLAARITHAPFATVVPGGQFSFLAVGALYGVTRVGLAITGRGIGVENDAGRFGGKAAGGEDYQGRGGREFR